MENRGVPALTARLLAAVVLTTAGTAGAMAPTARATDEPPRITFTTTGGLDHPTDPGDTSTDPGKDLPDSRADVPGKNGLKLTGRYDACVGYMAFADTNSRDNILDDTFQWGSYARFRIGDGNGNINWLANPYRQVSWYMWLHSLRWTGAALEAAKEGDDEALDHVRAIAKDWVKDNPYSWKANIAAWESTMHRTNILLCLRSIVTDRTGGALPAADRWLDATLVQHAEYLKNQFSGYGNHGTDESLAMLGIGTTVGRADYTALAQQRLAAILAKAIDAEGATNEQSTGYAIFNYYLWGRVGAEVANLLPGSPLDQQISVKRESLLNFLAHSFTPAATPFQIGNTERARRQIYAGTVQEWPASGGAAGTPPAQRVGIFNAAGYVFGRDTWGTDERSFATSSAYTLRFGPARTKHGHHDHTAITWYADGSPVLIDSGYGEYTKDAWETYAKSTQAHNQLIIGGMKDSVATSLTRRVLSAGTSGPMADYYRLVDAPGVGFTRVRDVLVLSDPEVIFVVDRATAPAKTTFNQLWHLPAGSVAGANSVAAHASYGERSITVVSLPYAGQPVPKRAISVIRGSSRPIQGWFWPNIFTKQAAPVVSVNRSGTSASLVTAIVSGPAEATVTATSTATRRGSGAVYTITVGDERVQIGQSAGGSLYRIN
ncbi:MAG: heparinase II/III family protein [Austwickia sp.]|nr:heparinase II/III family protein [Austwickia sp.]